jgi:hypothetical protein
VYFERYGPWNPLQIQQFIKGEEHKNSLTLAQDNVDSIRAKGFNCLVFGRTGAVFFAPALGLDADYFSVCKTQLDHMQHCVPTPGLLCSKAKLELDWIF